MTELEPQFLEVVSTSAQELRSTFTPLQQGVLELADLKVTAGGGTREVVPAAGIALVKGDRITDQGMYRIRNDAAKSSLAFEVGGITANSSGNPRIDQIICRVFDHSADGSGRRNWRLEVCTGTATAGATLDNRNGAMSDTDIRNAGAIASGWVRLADVLVPAGATTISAGNIRDRRPWARGFAVKGAGSATTQSTTSTTLTLIDPALAIRVEVSPGTHVRLRGSARLVTPANGSNLPFFINGAQMTNWGVTQPGSTDNHMSAEWEGLNAGPGSTLFEWRFASQVGGQTTSCIGAFGTSFWVEEIVGGTRFNG